jgi:hypothetical protein
MTTINRICFEFSDIVAVQLECLHCHATISFPRKGWEPAALQCPNCKVTLVTDKDNPPEFFALSALSDALKDLSNNKFAFQLRLEFAHPDD